MAYSPISGTVPQYTDGNGDPYSGAVLKAYSAGTATLLQMATTAAAGTLVNSIALNASGFPEVSGNVVIPHVNANYKLALYPTQAAADLNSGAIWTIDNLTPTGISAEQVQTISTLTTLRNYTGVATTIILDGAASAGDGAGGTYYYVSGAAPSTYTDDGDFTIVPTGGDGSAAWLKIYNAINLQDRELKRAKLTDYSETVVAHGSTGTTETFDLESGPVHTATLDNNCTFTFSNPPATGIAGSFTMILTQDGTGSRTVTWPASVKWASGAAPTLSSGAADIDILSFLTINAGTTWYGIVGGYNFS